MGDNLAPMMKRFFSVLLILTVLSGCASVPTDPAARREYDAANDPLEPMNRAIMSFNDAAQTYLLTPVAKGYRAVTTRGMRKGVRAFTANIKTPLTVINDLLQANFSTAGKDLSRFLINSTLGFFGFFDVADRMGLAPNEQSFGTTLAVWGVPEGPYLVLPFLGPSDLRDTAGLAADYFADPKYYYMRNHDTGKTRTTMWTVTGVGALADYENAMDMIDGMRKESLDFYAYARSLYRQHRKKQIDEAKGVKPDEHSPAYDFSFDEEEDF